MARVSINGPIDLAVDEDVNARALNEAPRRLANHSERLAQVVVRRYFGGHDETETALVLDISEREVRRERALARACLHRELEAARQESGRRKFMKAKLGYRLWMRLSDGAHCGFMQVRR